MMRTASIAGFAACFLLMACDTSASAPAVDVRDAWVRLPAVAGRPAAGYFVATANSDGDAITGVATRPGRVELHESMAMDGMMSMHAIESAPLERGKPVAFAPAGKHLMLFDLDPSLRSGGAIDLTVTFAKAPPVTVEARVVAAGDPAPE